MDDTIELTLLKAVDVTDTSHIRAFIQERMDRDGLRAPPVELVRFHVVILCTGGNGIHMVDFEDIEVTAGTAIWIRPGQVQRWSDTHDRFDAQVVVFESSIIPDLPFFDRFGGEVGVVHTGHDAAAMQQQMEWMAADLHANQDQAVAAAVVGVILRLFARHVTTHRARHETPRTWLAAAFSESVDEHPEQRSVEWHARRIGASTRSVARATLPRLRES